MSGRGVSGLKTAWLAAAATAALTIAAPMPAPAAAPATMPATPARSGAPARAVSALHVVVIEGLGGEADYTHQFDTEAQALAASAQRLVAAGADADAGTGAADVRLLAGAAATRSAVLAYFHSLAGSMHRDDRLIVYLVGHGSYDGRQYKFNIPGPDLSDHDLAAMLDALPARRQLLVATGSASGALLQPLRRPGRILITGTRNGAERNVTHFAAAFVAALTAPAADLDKNGNVSAQEAFDYANRRVQDYFKQQALLASEHAVIQGAGGAQFTVGILQSALDADRGAGAADGAGPAGLAGAAGSARPEAAVPPELARRRADLNARIRALEQRKATLPPAQYAAQLDPLLLQLAEVQDRIDQGEPHAH
jgi:hypothetical protein